jgi:SagB-type dehydrogenase family enzyme
MNRSSVIAGLMALFACLFLATPVPAETRMEIPMTIDLPSPKFESGVSVEEALTRRRSLRRFADAPLTLAEAGQLLWAAQGVTHSAGYRTAPSAGALYPLELFIVAGAVTDLPSGVYRYLPREHDLVRVREGDQRPALTAGALGQGMLRKAPAVLVFCAVYERITGKYDERGVRYAHMEAGHAAQNVHLQAVALGLGSVPVGAFREDGVRSAIGAEADETPVYLVPVGRGE